MARGAGAAAAAAAAAVACRCHTTAQPPQHHCRLSPACSTNPSAAVQQRYKQVHSRTWCSSRSVGNQGPSRIEKKSGVRSSTSSCTWSGLQVRQVRAGHELATGAAGQESQVGAALCTQVRDRASAECCPSLQPEQQGQGAATPQHHRPAAAQHNPAAAAHPGGSTPRRQHTTEKLEKELTA